MEPFTDFAQVPLVMTIDDAARVLNISVKTLRRRLETNEQVPGVLPRRGQAPWQFSKAILQRYIEGGYTQIRVVRRRA